MVFKKFINCLNNDRSSLFLKFDENYLYFMRGDQCENKMAWNSVLEIVAFKRDLFAVDLICIGFRVDHEGNIHEIDEDIEGYKLVYDFIHKKFSMEDNWFSTVASPAFTTNLTSLWGEPLQQKIWEDELEKEKVSVKKPAINDFLYFFVSYYIVSALTIQALELFGAGTFGWSDFEYLLFPLTSILIFFFLIVGRIHDWFTQIIVAVIILSAFEAIYFHQYKTKTTKIISLICWSVFSCIMTYLTVMIIYSA